MDLFSKREKRRRGDVPAVYQFDELPEAFRVQVLHLWDDGLGHWAEPDRYYPIPRRHPPNDWWLAVHRALARERGVMRLVPNASNPAEGCRLHLMAAPTEQALDLVELSFRVMEAALGAMEDYERREYGLSRPASVIAELNGRFREHGIGYQFAGGQIHRVDSEFLHAEAVQPGLALLHGSGDDFAGPLEEFLTGHEHYRKANHKDAIVWACKAFESTLKAICTVRGYPFDPKSDAAAKLLKAVFDGGLVPDYLQSEFTALQSVLSAGVPTVRNKTSGHGQGGTPVEVPRHFAAYALNMTASNIVFLIESHKAAGAVTRFAREGSC